MKRNRDDENENIYNKDELIEELKNKLWEENNDLKNTLYKLSLNENETIREYERSKVLDIWDANLVDLLNNLKKKYNIRDKGTLAEIIGKAFEKLYASARIANKEIELLFIAETLDPGLTQVIERRFNQNSTKNKELFLLNVSFAQFLICPENKDLKLEINKFSVLHHWTHEDNHNVPYINEKNRYALCLINKMPNISAVVLRGCSTAGALENKNLIRPKKCTVIGKNRKIIDCEVEEDEFLFQQIHDDKESNKVRTFVKFRNINNHIILKEILDIPPNPQGNKLIPAVEDSLALTAKKYGLPPLSLSSQEIKVSKIRDAWLANKKIEIEDQRIIKAVDTNKATYNVSEFPSASLAGSLCKALGANMIKKGVTVKAYAGPYDGSKQAGTVNASGHGHDKLPKALRVTL